MSREVLTGAAGARAIRDTIGMSFIRHGLAPSGKVTYAARRSDGLYMLADVHRSRKSAHPGVAASIVLEVGLGLAPDASDLRTAAMRSLAFVMGDGDGCLALCREHDAIVEGWRSLGPEADRVATLLGMNVRGEWRNAPDVLWFRDREDLTRWGRLLDEQLPSVLSKLERAQLDRSRPALGLRLAE
jgi:hypothetical protein